MQLAYAMFADAAQVGADGKVSIIGGDFDTINAPSFPALHPNLAIVLRLSITKDECGQEHRLSISLSGPLGRNLLPEPLTGSFTPQIPPDYAEGPIRAIFVVNIASLVFEIAGTYRFHIAVDGKSVGEVQLHLVRAAIPGGDSRN
jgi:hypothetical protein